MAQVAARWPSRLADPVFPHDTLIRYRAQSILTEPGAPGPLLPIDQARDVVRWHESHLQRRQADTVIRRIAGFFTTKRKAP